MKKVSDTDPAGQKSTDPDPRPWTETDRHAYGHRDLQKQLHCKVNTYNCQVETRRIEGKKVPSMN